ncbi:MAG: hypothetical protein EBV34_18785 [Betaproteobacteria bacterium]|nr:hypothetical protein [Betaproteobacteria bacterium]
MSRTAALALSWASESRNTSLPAPPSKLSAPPPPTRLSLPGPPTIRLVWFVPTSKPETPALTQLASMFCTPNIEPETLKRPAFVATIEEERSTTTASS